MQTLRLNELLLSVMEMLRRTLGDHVSLTTTLSADLWETEADPGVQFQSAIVNLAVNARDAMPKGGRLIIETRNTALDAGQLGTESEVTPGPYIQLSISDTGTGISPEVRARAFEPFFTTKEKGRGTGLGLAMVYGFVKQAGGHITIYSEVGHGTTFNLYLPRGRKASHPVLSPTTTGERLSNPMAWFLWSRITQASGNSPWPVSKRSAMRFWKLPMGEWPRKF